MVQIDKKFNGINSYFMAGNLDCGNFIYVACYFSSRWWHEIFNISAVCQKLNFISK